MELKGKTAIVTGASRGIGLAVVQSLLEKGIKVAGWSRTDPEIDNPNFAFFPTDVSSYEAVEASFSESLIFLESNVHILINNAGYGIFNNIEDYDIQDWQGMFDINVHGVFYCTKKVVPVMKKQQLGHIINVASVAGTTGIEGASGYCATKFAVRGISQSLFKELRSDNIKVSCIYPGSVNTNFFDEIDSVTSNDTMLNPSDIAKMIINILETADNYLTVDVEVRPMSPRYS